jgi:hypothetical protein
MSPTSDVFGDVSLGATVTHQYTLTNDGQAPLPTPTVEVTGAAYTVDSTMCPALLDAGATCVVSVTFQPSALGTQTSTVIATIGPLSAGCGLIARGTSQLSASKLGSGVGTVSGGGLNCGATCTATVASTPITLTATATTGSVFSGWAGAAAGCGSNATCDVPIATGAVAAIANFTDLPTLTVAVVNGAGVTDGSVEISDRGDGQPGSCTNDCSFDYPAATVVHLTAIEDIDVCRQFDGWSGACFGQPTVNCTLTVSSNMSTSAGFSRKPSCNPK